MIRLFLAAEIPPNWQSELDLIKIRVEKRFPSARWVPAANMHITLKFLGNCEDDMPDKITSCLMNVLSEVEPFHFKLGELGGFPLLQKARIFWMGAVEGKELMAAVASRLEKALVPLGFEKEKRSFHSHVTLARLKQPQDFREVAASQNLEHFSKSIIKMNHVTLFKSTLTPSGAIYKPLSEIPLG